jgi:hypothetical protein
MTQHKARKKATRRRMAKTGEPYTLARRAAEAEYQAHGPQRHQIDGNAPDTAVELAKQADAMQEQGVQVYRAVQQYVADAGTSEAGMQSVAHQLGEAMDQGTAKVIAAVQNLARQSTGTALSGEGTLGGGQMLPGVHLSGVGSLGTGATVMAHAGLALGRGSAPSPNVITVSDNESIRPENLNRLLAKASRDGIAGLSTVQVLALVLICLLALGAPFAQLTLPPEAQALLGDEYGTLSLGLTIALLIVRNGKH